MNPALKCYRLVLGDEKRERIPLTSQPARYIQIYVYYCVERKRERERGSVRYLRQRNGAAQSAEITGAIAANEKSRVSVKTPFNNYRRRGTSRLDKVFFSHVNYCETRVFKNANRSHKYILMCSLRDSLQTRTITTGLATIVVLRPCTRVVRGTLLFTEN